jgi:hypothetical protein
MVMLRLLNVTSSLPETQAQQAARDAGSPDACLQYGELFDFCSEDKEVRDAQNLAATQRKP